MNSHSDIQLLDGVTKYLDYSGQFIAFQRAINEFITMISEHDTVGNLLLKEPHVVEQMFNRVLNLAIQTEALAENRLIGQVQANIQIMIPPLSSITISSMKHCIPNSGLFVISGVLIARTTMTKYCKSVVYRCPTEDCPGHKGQRVFGNPTTAKNCSLCGCRKKEFLRARVNGDQVIAVFISPKSFEQNFTRHQGINVCLKDSLTRDLELGVHYNVVASFQSVHCVGWGIERKVSEHHWRFQNNFPAADIPREIILLEECIKEMCPNSPWAFTATLSSQLASDLYPQNSFFQLKTGLLLSLASQDENKTPVSILAVGPDCCYLLQAASHLSQRRVAITSSALCGGSMGVSSGDEWIEAGPLVLATGGVCYIGDWAKFNPSSGRSSAASQIISALESGRIDLMTSNQSSLLGSPLSLPLRSAVWTFWSGDKATSTARAQLRTLIEVFGMPFIGDGGGDVETVSEYLLSKSMQLDFKHLSGLVSIKSLKKYLSIVSSHNVQLTPEASKLLRNYFVASRRERPDCLPVTAIKTMTSLAEAHARLCLRTHVMYEDVVLVVYLYEDAINALFGPSVMSPSPNLFAGIKPDSNQLSFGQQITLLLKEFSIWLEQYIKSLLSDDSVNCSIPEE